jgi:hypothetical protein
MSKIKNQKFKAAIALEKLYHNRGFSQDAFSFNLTDEKPKKLRRPSSFSFGRFFSNLAYKMFCLVWLALFFAGNILVNVIR